MHITLEEGRDGKGRIKKPVLSRYIQIFRTKKKNFIFYLKFLLEWIETNSWIRPFLFSPERKIF